MLATTEVANATELAKRAFPGVSHQTISRELKEHGLICRVHQSCPYISPANQIKRYAWAKEHQSWTPGMWKRIIFSDESKFLLFKSDGRQYAWFKPGQALDPRFVQKTIKHGAGNIMVWGCVMGQGMGRLHWIDRIMCSTDYVEILKKSYLGTLKDYNLKHSGPEGVRFQQDNDPKHTSKVTKEFFAKRRIKVLDWAPSSPDMNIIEHVWDQIDHLVRSCNPLPCNRDELWEALQEEWENFPQEALDKLYKSMPCHVAALIAARGGNTKY